MTFGYRVMVTAFAILAMFRGIPGIKSHIVHSLVANWGSRKLNSPLFREVKSDKTFLTSENRKRNFQHISPILRLEIEN